MATDAVGEHGDKLVEGTNFYITLSPSSVEETDRLFNGLSNGGKVTSPLKKEFWGAYFGTCTDKFGIQWMFSYDERYVQQ